jgi:MFS family permease
VGGEPAVVRPGRLTFPIVLIGQSLSTFGSSLTGFALGVWVYQSTGSVTRFALISFFTLLPGIALAPIAGAFVDRWDRRWTMILSDFGAGLTTLAIALLLAAHRLEIWHIYVLMALNSAFNAPQTLAYSAAVPLLVPRKQLGRANGLIQLGGAAAEIGAPLAAGILLSVVSLRSIIMVDFLTAILAAASLLPLRIPEPAPSSSSGRTAERSSLLTDAAFGWSYIRARPGLFALMFFFTALNFSRGAVLVLITPLVLAFASAKVLGGVAAIAGGGMVAGGIFFSIWGGPRRQMYGIYVAVLVYSVMLFLGGLKPNATLIAITAFFLMSTGPTINSGGQAIWHAKVPAELQGRVQAMRRLLSWSTLPLASLLAGPLTDHVFEPLLARGGPLAGSVGRLIGVGPGRGIGFFFSLLGLSTFLFLILAWFYPRLRHLEDELPDALLPMAPTAPIPPATPEMPLPLLEEPSPS